MNRRRAVFLDRDGVINRNVFDPVTQEYGAPRTAEAFQLAPGAIPALAALQRAGFLLFLVSNQPDYAKGKCSLEDLAGVHRRFESELDAAGVVFTRFYYCYHHPKGIVEGFSGACNCRKPSPYFLFEARDAFSMSLESSWIIGDRSTDVECGQIAGVRTIRVEADHPGERREDGAKADFAAVDLAAAVRHILAWEKGPGQIGNVDGPINLEVKPVVAILAGGLATRLGPIAATTPKSMLNVAGEPFIAHQLRRFAAQDLRDVVICGGHLGSQIKEFVGSGASFGCQVRYSFDGDKLLGTGGALRKALPMLGTSFIVTYGDSYLTHPFLPVWQAFLKSGNAALMTVFGNEGKWDTSNVEFGKGGIVRYLKSPSGKSAAIEGSERMKHIDYGLGCIRSEALAAWSADEPFDLGAFYGSMLEKNDLAAFEVKERFYEVGSISGLKDTEAFLSRLTLSGVEQ